MRKNFSAKTCRPAEKVFQGKCDHFVSKPGSNVEYPKANRRGGLHLLSGAVNDYEIPFDEDEISTVASSIEEEEPLDELVCCFLPNTSDEEEDGDLDFIYDCYEVEANNKTKIEQRKTLASIFLTPSADEPSNENTLKISCEEIVPPPNAKGQEKSEIENVVEESIGTPHVHIDTSMSLNNNSTRSLSDKKAAGVYYGTVEVREYEVELGDNPSCSSGPALTIGWEHKTVLHMSVCAFECDRADKRRCAYAMRLSRTEREVRLESYGISLQGDQLLSSERKKKRKLRPEDIKRPRCRVKECACATNFLGVLRRERKRNSPKTHFIPIT